MSLTRRRILVVDDSRINRLLLRAQLESLGYEVSEAGDGLDALSVLEQQHIDALITDILMPRMDGFRLCQEIRSRPALRELPVVAYTNTYVAEGDDKVALHSGADCYLVKPAPPQVLDRTLRGLLTKPVAPHRDPGPPEQTIMREYNAALISKLEQKTQELEGKNAQLLAASQQLRALAARVEEVREQERTRLAREIHDVLAQELTRLKIDLVWLSKRTAKPIDEALRESIGARVQDALRQTDVAISTVQRIATDLRPVVLDSLGLAAALEWQAEDFSRRTGVVCRTATPDTPLELDRDRATALFRILQESLTNVARHAAATEVEIILARQHGEVAMTVKDNGRGIPRDELSNPLAIGLAGMRERAQAFGGMLEIFGGPGGTQVCVRIPLESANPLP